MNKRYLVVEDAPHLVRDTKTGAIININDAEYKMHKKKKNIQQELQNKERLRDARINTLENDVQELKAGITEILKILKNGNN